MTKSRNVSVEEPAPSQLDLLGSESGRYLPRPLVRKEETVEMWCRIAPAKPTIVFESLWNFATERQAIFHRRTRGSPGPWTVDPILRAYKFTNAYRASDRVSQFLVRNVIYGTDGLSPEDTVFRILLFKLFNRVDTWNALEAAVGPIRWSTYSFSRYDRVLDALRGRGKCIYSAAYIMPAAPRPAGETRKYRSHLWLLERAMGEGITRALGRARNMKQAFTLLRNLPSIGDFLAYQFVTDLNYSEIVDFSESEFVVPGPGAKDGIRKCFVDLGGLTEADIIRWLTERQRDEFEARHLPFEDLWTRRLQLIDVQNLFCEISKYARVAHPEIAGTTLRTRIKQQFRANESLRCPWYPPKWGLNERIAKTATP